MKHNIISKFATIAVLTGNMVIAPNTIATEITKKQRGEILTMMNEGEIDSEEADFIIKKYNNEEKDITNKKFKEVYKIAFLKTIKNRLAHKPENYQRQEGVNFEDVKKALDKNPELMWSLYQMEETGGKPDVLFVTDNEFIFSDFSKESPGARRNLTYKQAEEMSKKMKVEIISKNAYDALQKLSKSKSKNDNSGKFDQKSYSWIRTPESVQISGKSLCCNNKQVVITDNNGSSAHRPEIGWRGILRIPKV